MDHLTTRRPGPGVPAWVPYALLALSLAVTFAIGDWALPGGPAPAVAGAVTLLAHRLAGELGYARFRLVGRVAWFVGLLTVCAATVVVAPMFCVYAFIGYLEAPRWLPPRAITAGLLAVAPICAVGQAGGVQGIARMPWLYIVLIGVNASLAPVMERLSRQREEDLLAREQAVRELEAEQHRTSALQAQLLEQAREAGIADERARLSREIHDTVAQGLIGIITQLEAIGPGPAPAGWRPRVDRAVQVARDSLAEARRAIHALGSPRLVDDDLPRALAAVVADWAATHDIRARVVIDGEPRAGAHDEALLRVAQESMANTARHSGAQVATFTLSYLDSEVRLDVRDDGRGFDPVSTPGGMGLAGMRDRVAELGGTLEIETTEGGGCTVSAAVPA